MHGRTAGTSDDACVISGADLAFFQGGGGGV